MPMQVLFAPGYIAPSRIRLEEQMLKQQAIETGIQNTAAAFQTYVDTKTKQKLEKLGTMGTLAATYGSNALGPEFQDEYGKMLHTYGIDLKKGADGKYIVPESFEGALRAHVIQHPELIKTLLGAQRPELSPGELQLKGEEQDIKLSHIEQQREADDLKFQETILTLRERLEAVEKQQTGALDRTKLTTGASITRTQLQVEAKQYGDNLAYAAKMHNIDAVAAVRYYGIDKKQVAEMYGIDMKSLDAELNRESQERRTTATNLSKEDIAKANRENNYQIAAMRYANQPVDRPSGLYNFKGQLVDAGTINADPGKYAGAWQLNNGQAKNMLQYSSLRDLNMDRANKLQLVEQKLKQDMANKDLTGMLQTVGLAIRNKDPRISSFAWGKLLHELNDKDHLGMTEDDLRVLSEHRGVLQSIQDWFAGYAPDGGNADTAPEVPAATTPSTTSTSTTGAPATTTSTLPPKPPQQAPSVGGSGVIHLDKDTDIQFQSIQ